RESFGEAGLDLLLPLIRADFGVGDVERHVLVAELVGELAFVALVLEPGRMVFHPPRRVVHFLLVARVLDVGRGVHARRFGRRVRAPDEVDLPDLARLVGDAVVHRQPHPDAGGDLGHQRTTIAGDRFRTGARWHRAERQREQCDPDDVACESAPRERPGTLSASEILAHRIRLPPNALRPCDPNRALRLARQQNAAGQLTRRRRLESSRPAAAGAWLKLLWRVPIREEPSLSTRGARACPRVRSIPKRGAAWRPCTP